MGWSLSPKAAQQPEEERQKDAEQDGSCQGKVDSGVTAATLPVQVAGKAANGKAEARGEQDHGTQGDEDEPQYEEGLSEFRHGVILTKRREWRSRGRAGAWRSRRSRRISGNPCRLRSISASKSEGAFGIAPLESMASGLVLSIHCSGVGGKAVDWGVCGYIQTSIPCLGSHGLAHGGLRRVA